MSSSEDDVKTVGVNLLWLVPGVVGGSEEYILRLLRAFDELAPVDLRLRLYVQRDLLGAHPDLDKRFEVLVCPIRTNSKPARIAAEHSWLAIASRSDDLVHHAGGVIPFLTSTPTVVTVHDLQPLDMPENFGRSQRAWFNTMLPRTASKALFLLCVSAFTAGRVSDLLGVESARIVVVPHGHEPVRPGVVDEAAHRNNLDRYGRFVLLPAIAYGHKRHVDLIDALGLLSASIPDLNVVMTGRAGPESPVLQTRISELGLSARCHDLGRVSEADLDSLFRSAEALVFPSSYEGFGNPVLEAMIRGCPVIATTAGSIPEVSGKAALLVEPADVEALARAIQRVLSDADHASRMVQLGLDQAAKFGWADAGEALVGAYRGALL